MKFINKLRSLGILFFLSIEFIFSGLRVILFSNSEIVDFEIVTCPNRDVISEAIDTRSFLERTEAALYGEEPEFTFISEDDMEDMDDV